MTTFSLSSDLTTPPTLSQSSTSWRIHFGLFTLETLLLAPSFINSDCAFLIASASEQRSLRVQCAVLIPRSVLEKSYRQLPLDISGAMIASKPITSCKCRWVQLMHEMNGVPQPWRLQHPPSGRAEGFACGFTFMTSLSFRPRAQILLRLVRLAVLQSQEGRGHSFSHSSALPSRIAANSRANVGECFD